MGVIFLVKQNIRMRLSYESKVVLEKLQKEYKVRLDNDISYSSLINIAVRTGYEKINNTNWLNIRDMVLDIDSDDIDSDYQSSFMLDEDVMIALNDMQNRFKEVFNAKRIFRGFCVRICLKAYYIDFFVDKNK